MILVAQCRMVIRDQTPPCFILDFPAGENCGFMGEISVSDLTDGMHEVTIRITASDEATAELSTTFEVDNHAFETGRVIGRVDRPLRGALFIPQEAVAVSGWALAPSGIRSIEATIDGEPRGRIVYGSLRADIGKRRHQYANADHCGFYGIGFAGWFTRREP